MLQVTHARNPLPSAARIYVEADADANLEVCGEGGGEARRLAQEAARCGTAGGSSMFSSRRDVVPAFS